MPTNLFGPRDTYDLHDSHVIPALIRKMHEAKINLAKEVVV
jgi:GDP-L-fucose synthase